MAGGGDSIWYLTFACGCSVAAVALLAMYISKSRIQEPANAPSSKQMESLFASSDEETEEEPLMKKEWRSKYISKLGLKEELQGHLKTNSGGVDKEDTKVGGGVRTGGSGSPRDQSLVRRRQQVSSNRPDKQASLDASLVVPGLWVGSIAAAVNREWQLDKGIKAVVTVMPEEEAMYMDVSNTNGELTDEKVGRSVVIPKRPDCTHHRLSVKDDGMHRFGEDLGPALDVIDAQIGAGGAGGAVLVHCQRGRSRSAALVMAYLMLRRDFTLHGAFHAVKDARESIQPRIQWMEELLELEEATRGVRTFKHKDNYEPIILS